MGLYSSGRISCGNSYTINPLNPNPKNFEFIKVEQFCGHVVAKIKYPNCTNYEGNKILVFKNKTKEEILNLTEIDPHFNKDEYAPFARLEPTNEGWLMAIHLCISMKKISKVVKDLAEGK